MPLNQWTSSRTFDAIVSKVGDSTTLKIQCDVWIYKTEHVPSDLAENGCQTQNLFSRQGNYTNKTKNVIYI